MTHKHSVYDTNLHFTIDPVARTIANQVTAKSILIQGDHNSERFTFELPRKVDGHDMTQCDKIEVHYINLSADKKGESRDVYLVDDVQVSPDSDEVAIFSWLISGNATKYEGILSFLIRFVCLTGETIDYAWHTGIYSNVTVGEGMNNTAAVIAEYSDVLEAWKLEVEAAAAKEAENALNEAKKADAELKKYVDEGFLKMPPGDSNFRQFPYIDYNGKLKYDILSNGHGAQTIAIRDHNGNIDVGARTNTDSALSMDNFGSTFDNRGVSECVTLTYSGVKTFTLASNYCGHYFISSADVKLEVYASGAWEELTPLARLIELIVMYDFTNKQYVVGAKMYNKHTLTVDGAEAEVYLMDDRHNVAGATQVRITNGSKYQARVYFSAERPLNTPF